jgi:hypothetical protein
MAIYRIFKTMAFQPEAIARMSAAYEEVLRVLQLADRQDPITELVAKKVIDVCQSGERPREHLRPMKSPIVKRSVPQMRLPLAPLSPLNLHRQR